MIRIKANDSLAPASLFDASAADYIKVVVAGVSIEPWQIAFTIYVPLLNLD